MTRVQFFADLHDEMSGLDGLGAAVSIALEKEYSDLQQGMLIVTMIVWDLRHSMGS